MYIYIYIYARIYIGGYMHRCSTEHICTQTYTLSSMSCINSWLVIYEFAPHTCISINMICIHQNTAYSIAICKIIQKFNGFNGFRY